MVGRYRFQQRGHLLYYYLLNRSHHLELPAWEKVQDVNLKSVYLCSVPRCAQTTKQGAGSIINTALFVAVMGSATSQYLAHRVEGRCARDEPRARGAVRASGVSVCRTHSARGQSTLRCFRSCSRRIQSAPLGGSCTCLLGCLRAPRSLRHPSHFSRVMMPPSSRRRRSLSMVG